MIGVPPHLESPTSKKEPLHRQSIPLQRKVVGESGCASATISSCRNEGLETCILEEITLLSNKDLPATRGDLCRYANPHYPRPSRPCLLPPPVYENSTYTIMSIDFPKEEEAIIQKWREIDAFRRQVRTTVAPTLCLAPTNSAMLTAPDVSRWNCQPVGRPILSTMALRLLPVSPIMGTCWHRLSRISSLATGL